MLKSRTFVSPQMRTSSASSKVSTPTKKFAARVSSIRILDPSLTDSEDVDWLMTELRKYKAVIEEEKPEPIKWYEEEQYDTISKKILTIETKLIEITG